MSAESRTPTVSAEQGRTSTTGSLEELAACRELLAAETDKADVGELASPITHEVNNLLNNLGLNLALLEYEFPSQAASLQRLRHQAETLTILIREFQEHSGRAARPAEPVALLPLFRQVLGELAGDEPWSGELIAEGAIPAVQGNRRDLQRLGRFLLKNVSEAARRARDDFGIRIAHEGERVTVRIDVPGVKGSPEFLLRLLEPNGEPLPGMSRLELNASRSLTRRLGGTLLAEEGSAGVQLVLRLPVF